MRAVRNGRRNEGYVKARAGRQRRESLPSQIYIRSFRGDNRFGDSYAFVYNQCIKRRKP